MPERVTTRRVGSPSAESTRFPGEGQSAQGQSGPKARPKGVADGQRANIPAPDGEVDGQATPAQGGAGRQTPPSRKGDGTSTGSPPRARPRKPLPGRAVGPYRNPTQVGRVSIPRRSGEPSRRNSAK